MSKANKLAINGILLLNKPKGSTSNYVLQKVKHLFQAKKAGHTGSLDPIATGMLPICFGEATKYSQYLLNADKCYEVTACLGVKTTTADATGDVTFRAKDCGVVSVESLQEALAAFRGKIKQVPSMFSALKHQGVPLYKYAREGKEVTRKARDITIYDLKLDAFEGDIFKLTVVCSKGTYIRNLVEDIGDFLKVGAHVTALHRVYTAGFENEPMYTLDELNELSAESRMALLHPVDRAVHNMPSITLTEQQVLSLRQGQWISTPESHGVDTLIRLFNHAEEFIGLGQMVEDNRMNAQRLMAY